MYVFIFLLFFSSDFPDPNRSIYYAPFEFRFGFLSCRCIFCFSFSFFGLFGLGAVVVFHEARLRLWLWLWLVFCAAFRVFRAFYGFRFSVYGLCLGFLRLSARFLLLLLCLRLESQLEYVSPPAANENRRNAAALRDVLC